MIVRLVLFKPISIRGRIPEGEAGDKIGETVDDGGSGEKVASRLDFRLWEADLDPVSGGVKKDGGRFL